MEICYVVLTDERSTARVYVFRDEEAAERFQRLQFSGLGHRNRVPWGGSFQAPGSGGGVRVAFGGKKPFTPLLAANSEVSEPALDIREVGELVWKYALWEPVIACNAQGFTHYHVALEEGVDPRVMPSHLEDRTCRTNMALEGGNGHVVAFEERPVFHVAARTPEEALHLVNPYCNTVPANHELSKGAMVALHEQLGILKDYFAQGQSHYPRHVLNYRDEPWFVQYNRPKDQITRVYRYSLANGYTEVLSPELPLTIGVRDLQIAVC